MTSFAELQAVLSDGPVSRLVYDGEGMIDEPNPLVSGRVRRIACRQRVRNHGSRLKAMSSIRQQE